MSEQTSTIEETVTEDRVYSKEELLKMRKQRETFYKDQIRELKLEEEFERLQADIEEHKLRQLRAMIMLAQIQAGPQPEEEEKEQPVPQPKEKPEETNINKGPKGKARTLKKD